MVGAECDGCALCSSCGLAVDEVEEGDAALSASVGVEERRRKKKIR